MRATLIPAAIVAIASTCCLHAQEISSAKELGSRGGLPNFFAKLQSGGDVRVGYLGGSITAANGWRVKSLKWLREQYPAANLSEINAAIGGTGSDLGVFRAEQDVISKKPDLLFIEFAVNDGGGDPLKIQRCMEGIVRQTWKANPETDICFVYTLSEPMLKEYQEGKFSRSAIAMEGVANHYGIPSIAFGPEVVKRVTDNTLIFTGTKEQADDKNGTMVFSTDGVHPLEATGHEVYQVVIARSLAALKGTGKTGAHPTIAPLHADNWQDAKIVPIKQSMLKGKWTKLDTEQSGRAKDFRNRLPEMWKAEEAGATLEFTVDGTVAQVYGLVGPDGGELSIEVDGGKPRTTLLFDRHCTYHRLAKTDLFSNLPAGKHTVKVTLTGNMPDKANILSETNRAKMSERADLYNQAVWHAGSLLIIGEVTE